LGLLFRLPLCRRSSGSGFFLLICGSGYLLESLLQLGILPALPGLLEFTFLSDGESLLSESGVGSRTWCWDITSILPHFFENAMSILLGSGR